MREGDTNTASLLGVVERFWGILLHATAVGQAERGLVNTSEEHLRQLMDPEATGLQRETFPTDRRARVRLGRVLA